MFLLQEYNIKIWLGSVVKICLFFTILSKDEHQKNKNSFKSNFLRRQHNMMIYEIIFLLKRPWILKFKKILKPDIGEDVVGWPDQ